MMTDHDLAQMICELLPQTREWESYCDSLSDDEVIADRHILKQVISSFPQRGEQPSL